MNTCSACNTTENIVHSGVDAFALGVMDRVGQICYECAHAEYRRNYLIEESLAGLD